MNDYVFFCRSKSVLRQTADLVWWTGCDQTQVNTNLALLIKQIQNIEPKSLYTRIDWGGARRGGRDYGDEGEGRWQDQTKTSKVKRSSTLKRCQSRFRKNAAILLHVQALFVQYRIAANSIQNSSSVNIHQSKQEMITIYTECDDKYRFKTVLLSFFLNSSLW